MEIIDLTQNENQRENIGHERVGNDRNTSATALGAVNVT